MLVKGALNPGVVNKAPFIAVSLLVLVAIIAFISEWFGAKDYPRELDGGRTSEVAAKVDGARFDSGVFATVVKQGGGAVNSAPSLRAGSGDVSPSSSDVSQGPAPTRGASQLSDLVAGLEAKVAAHPDNLGNQILLAQTYAEIGKEAKAFELLRRLRHDHVENMRVALVLATILIRSGDQTDLDEARQLLDLVDKQSPDQRGAVHLYRGRLYMKALQRDAAIMEWTEALSELPPSDSYREPIKREMEIYSTKRADVKD